MLVMGSAVLIVAFLLPIFVLRVFVADHDLDYEVNNGDWKYK